MKRQLDEKLKREKQTVRRSLSYARRVLDNVRKRRLTHTHFCASQVDALENSQAKTLSEVRELRNQHNLSKRKLERLETDLADVRCLCSCANGCCYDSEARAGSLSNAVDWHDWRPVRMFSGSEIAPRCRRKRR